MSNAVVQPENPSHQATQATDLERDTSLIIPAGTEVREEHLQGSNVVTRYTYHLSSPATQSVRLRVKNDTAIGAAHRSFAADIAARAKSLRPVQYAGIGLILSAIALLYFKWPTPAIVSGVSGVGLIVLSNVLVSHAGIIAAVFGIGLVILLIFYAYNKGVLNQFLPDNLDKKDNKKQVKTETVEKVEKTETTKT